MHVTTSMIITILSILGQFCDIKFVRDNFMKNVTGFTDVSYIILQLFICKSLCMDICKCDFLKKLEYLFLIQDLNILNYF